MESWQRVRIGDLSLNDSHTLARLNSIQFQVLMDRKFKKGAEGILVEKPGEIKEALQKAL